MGTPTLADIDAAGEAISARSLEIEQARTLPPDVVEVLRALGVFRMWVPERLGGPGMSARDGLMVMEALGYFDGSAGWCSMISSTTSLLAEFLPAAAASEIFGSPDLITGGFAMPAGRATLADGGLRVSGRWQWGSGTQHCTWIGGGCLIVDADGTPTRRSDGLGAPYVFVPASDVEFIDTWDVAGLSGTGSCDYQLTDVFVPEGRWVQIGRDRPEHESAMSRFSFYGLLACGVAAVSVGIGRRAIAELVALAAEKKPQGSARTLRERPQTQAEVAIAEAKLGAAWTYLLDCVDRVWQTTSGGQEPTIEQRRQLRLAATHATQTAADVSSAMYRTGGGAAIFRSSPLQRAWRDASVATQHAMVAPRMFDTCGRLRLGLDTDTAQL